MHKIIIKPFAESDIAEAAIWYQNVKEGLGDQFLETIDKTIKTIQRNPNHFQLVHINIRRALTQKFPYAIFFVVESKTIYVLAILHTRRNPSLWKMRK